MIFVGILLHFKKPKLLFIFCFSSQSTSLLHRSCSVVWSSHPHRIHRSHSVWADRSDLPHPACDDRCDPGQCCGTIAPAVSLWFHHSHQETPLFARVGHGPSWVRLSMCSQHISPFNVVLIWRIVSPTDFSCFSPPLPHLTPCWPPRHVSGSITSAWRTSWSGMCASSLLTHPTGSCRRCWWPVISKHWRWWNQEVTMCCCLGDCVCNFNSSSPFGSNTNSIVMYFLHSYILTAVYSYSFFFLFLSTKNIPCCCSASLYYGLARSLLRGVLILTGH